MAASSDAGSNFACNGPSSAVTPSTSVNPVSKKGRGTSFASSSCVSKLQVANSDAPMIKRLKNVYEAYQGPQYCNRQERGEEQTES